MLFDQQLLALFEKKLNDLNDNTIKDVFISMKNMILSLNTKTLLENFGISDSVLALQFISTHNLQEQIKSEIKEEFNITDETTERFEKTVSELYNLLNLEVNIGDWLNELSFEMFEYMVLCCHGRKVEWIVMNEYVNGNLGNQQKEFIEIHCQSALLGFKENILEKRIKDTKRLLIDTRFDKTTLSHNDVVMWKSENPECCNEKHYLTKMYIPSSVKILNTHAFYKMTHLKEVVLTNNVASIHGECFIGCTNLTDFSIENCTQFNGIVPYWISKLLNKKGISCSNIIFTAEDKHRWQIEHIDDCNEEGELEKIVIPSTVKYIDSKCFENCYSLKSVVFSSSIYGFCDNAFHNCPILTNMYIPNCTTYEGLVPYWISVMLEQRGIHCTNVTFTQEDSILWQQKHKNDCDSLNNLTKIVLPSTITSISDFCFAGFESLLYVIIPLSVEYIGKWAFANCFNLVSVFIPKTVKSLGKGCFYKCYKLKMTQQPINIQYFGHKCFSHCSELKGIIDAPKNCWD
ncbi:hypothetical protein QTN25_010588 [Entamoeba marina]